MKEIKVGSVVKWCSPRPGKRGMKAHEGTVIEVVPDGCEPHWRWDSTPRDHESYLIEDNHSGELFWPRVKWLEDEDDAA